MSRKDMFITSSNGSYEGNSRSIAGNRICSKKRKTLSLKEFWGKDIKQFQIYVAVN